MKNARLSLAGFSSLTKKIIASADARPDPKALPTQLSTIPCTLTTTG